MDIDAGKPVQQVDRAVRPEGATYRFRHGTHELRLNFRGLSDGQVDDVAHGEAEFALLVEGPLIALGYRFGDSGPWSCSSPFQWHGLPPDERVVPAEVPLTPQSRCRLWATLWITLTDADTGAVLARRAAALPPEFTIALHEAIRAQAREPFSDAAGQHALAWLSHQAEPLPGRAARLARCPSPHGHAAAPGDVRRRAIAPAARNRPRSFARTT